MNEITATSASLSGSHCECEWADAEWHDRMLAIEDAGPYWAVDMIREVVWNTENLIPGWCVADIEEFVTQHNWKNPRQMSALASDLHALYWISRETQSNWETECDIARLFERIHNLEAAFAATEDLGAPTA